MKTQNLRTDPETGMKVVTGMPVRVGTLPAGHRLVLVDASRYITTCDGQLWCNGVAVAPLPGTLVGVHRVGQIIVVAGTQGMLFAVASGDGLVVADVGGALPLIALGERPATTLTAAVPAVSFDEPYTRWQAPLRHNDLSAVSTALRTTWNEITAMADADGSRYAPVRVRFAVRLYDDSYLWMSEAVELGDAQLASAPHVRAEATVSGGEVTGVPAATVTLPTYTLDIAVSRGVDVAWRGMVKAIDIFATDSATLLQGTSVVSYRMTTTAQRVPVLDYGFDARTPHQVAQQLERSPWTVVASTTDLDALAEGRWVDSDTLPDTVLSADQCRALERGIDTSRHLVATLVCNGRLYAADDTGLMTTSRAANALVTERQWVVSGAHLLGLAAVPRSLYSGGFGRYPVYLFTDEGVFALPLTTQGAYGEPRLLSRIVLNANTRPVEADRDVCFTSSRGHLCRLRGSEVTVVARHAAMQQMVWAPDQGELWCLDDQQALWALVGDHLDRRTLPATQLWGSVDSALAVEADGTLRDLQQELPTMMPVYWLSNALAVTRPPKSVVWDIAGDQVDLQLDVLGERGISCHGFLVNRMKVTGRVGAPIVGRLLNIALRTIRSQVNGTAATATLINVRWVL